VRCRKNMVIRTTLINNLTITVSTRIVDSQLSYNAFNLLVKFLTVLSVDAVSTYLRSPAAAV